MKKIIILAILLLNLIPYLDNGKIKISIPGAFASSSFADENWVNLNDVIVYGTSNTDNYFNNWVILNDLQNQFYNQQTNDNNNNNNIQYDCAGVANGSAYTSDCGCIGGTTGISYCSNSTDEDCSITIMNALTELTGNTKVANETVSISDVENLEQTRTKNYEWVILKSTGWYLFSLDKGVHVKKDNPNPSLQWEWQSFEHQDITRVGVVVGGSVEYGLRTATPTLGRFNAIMELDFKVTYSVACKGSPVSYELAYKSTKAFSVNDK